MGPIDLLHLGRERVIGCWEVDGLLIDPGPASTLDSLLAGLSGSPPRGLLLTHIHLDHAGAAGALAERFPGLPVWVHESGAPHLADPSRLLASARRLYGEDLERLWGEVAPVPDSSLRPLAGGERVEGFRVEHTPGHAGHHVCFLCESSGRAFVGDVAGVRIPPAELVMPPTPPPEIDVEAWQRSLDLLERWRPRSLALTHFGAIEERVPETLAELRERLAAWASLARETDPGSFAAAVRREVAEATDASTRVAYFQAMPPEQLWYGLDRYWRRRGDRAGT